MEGFAVDVRVELRDQLQLLPLQFSGIARPCELLFGVSTKKFPTSQIYFLKVPHIPEFRTRPIMYLEPYLYVDRPTAETAFNN